MKFNIKAKKVFLSFVMAAAVVSVGLSAAVPATVSAQGRCSSSGSNGVGRGLGDLASKSDGSITCPVNVNDKSGAVALIAKIIDWALYVSGAIAVIYIVYGGYRYMMSGGNEETATKARQTVYNALIGLIIIILAYVIVNAVANLITSP